MFSFPLGADAELRLLQQDHAHSLFDLTDRSREHLREWLPWVDQVQTPEDSAAFIAAACQQWARGDGFHAGIWLQGELAGVIGHHSINRNNGTTSLGYWLGASFQGQGLMTRACSALIDHAFQSLRLHRVEIRVASENTRSKAIPERLGFQREGLLRSAENLYGRHVDHIVYGLLADEWPRP